MYIFKIQKKFIDIVLKYSPRIYPWEINNY